MANKRGLDVEYLHTEEGNGKKSKSDVIELGSDNGEFEDDDEEEGGDAADEDDATNNAEDGDGTRNIIYFMMFSSRRFDLYA